MLHLYLLAAEGSSSGLLGALGIDWKALLLNAVAFLAIAALLGKFVYPVLLKALDAKQAQLEAAAQAEADAKRRLEETQLVAEKLIDKARRTAADLVQTAQIEAGDIVTTAHTQADEQAKRIIAEGQARLEEDVEEARQSLRTETAGLVAHATAIVLDEKLDRLKDAELIERSLKVGAK